MNRTEPLVLFEWVHRQEDHDGRLDDFINDVAEREVRWGISAALESLLVEPFHRDYKDLLEAARARLRPVEE